MKYQAETLQESLVDMTGLFEAHWSEISDHKHLKILKPDYEMYRLMEEDGEIRIFTVREDEGKLVGYFVTFIQSHIHYEDCIYAMNDILYLHPDHRGGTTGYRMIKEALRDIKENTDADILCIHMKVKYPFRKLLAKLNFELSEENWEVEL